VTLWCAMPCARHIPDDHQHLLNLCTASTPSHHCCQTKLVLTSSHSFLLSRLHFCILEVSAGGTQDTKGDCPTFLHVEHCLTNSCLVSVRNPIIPVMCCRAGAAAATQHLLP
jgi:hypothetical protein